jgi:hypothetical protein
MVVIITTTYAINPYHHNVVNSNPAHEEVYSIQHYVIMLVSDLRQVSDRHKNGNSHSYLLPLWI